VFFSEHSVFMTSRAHQQTKSAVYRRMRPTPNSDRSQSPNWIWL